MQKENELAIIIPTYTNTKGLLKLISQLQRLSYHVIIVDNNPTEQKTRLRKQQNTIYLPQIKNMGFAKAVNIGAKYAKSRWLLILNDDIEFKNIKTIENTLNYAKNNNLIATTPVLKKSNGEVENIGYRVLPIGRIELIKDVLHYKLYISQDKLDGITAACLFIKKKAFADVGGFDVRFFAYLEDVDLCLRLKKRNQRFKVYLKEEVIHNQGSTSMLMGNFKQRQDLKNWILLISKHWDRKTLIYNLPSIMFERLRNISGYLKITYKKNKK